MMQFLFLVSMIFQSASSVHVRVMDAEGQALPNVRVELILYEFTSGKAEARIAFSEHCITDQNGECGISIGETSGMLRGRLDLGECGGRDVIWPGGVLDVPVMVDLENMRVKGTEAGPYDFQERDGGVLIRRTPWVAIVIVSVLMGGAVFWAYALSRREHA